MTMKSIRVIFGHAPFGKARGEFSKQESCSSLVSTVTTQTEVSSSTLCSLNESQHSLSTQSFSRPRTVCFDVDQYDEVNETVYDIPTFEDEDKSALFWTNDEISARSLERSRMVETECEDRTRFIDCIEKLFDVPLRKRASFRKGELDFGDNDSITDEAAIQEISSSDYRGYEHRCCRSIVALRRRNVRQVLTAFWVRGKYEAHEVAVKLNRRQARFAHLVAQGDAKFASDYCAAQ
jgi:hypothetical protein